MELPIELHPFDDHNRELRNQVAPPDWKNPVPEGRYNLVVVGAGTAGLVTAAGAAGLGAKVALIERSLMGGDCLNVGCVPSKGLIAAGRAASSVNNAESFGVRAGVESVDFNAVMERMRQLRASISPNDSASRFSELGVDVFLGNGRFTGSESIDVDGQELTFSKAVIATGARAARLPIPGLESVDYLTNESVFSLTLLPKRMVVIGGGPIGAELSQTFQRLGSSVTLIEKSGHILSREDPDAARVVQASLQRDGVDIVTAASVVSVSQADEVKSIEIEVGGLRQKVEADALLVSIGRAPNVTDMGLENVGVSFDERTGIHVDDRLRTTNSRIFAAGDVCSKHKFTHAADFMARIVIRNALFKGRAKVSDLIIPWCTYTSPELAHVGLSEAEATANGVEFDSFVTEFADVDRAILEGETEGFVKVVVKKGADQIIGATVVAANAGDMIGELTLAMKYKIGLSKIADTIHPYPTQAEAIRKLGDQYNRGRLTPFVKRLFSAWLVWTR